MIPAAAPYLLSAIALGSLVLLAPRLLARGAAAFRMTALLRRPGRRRGSDLVRAAAYHRHLAPAVRVAALDDRVWEDLDLDAVFIALDRTTSEPGRQVLYHLLRTPASDEAPLLRFEAAVHALSTDPVAARAEAALRRLDDPRAGHLVELLFGELPERPRLWWCVPLLTVSSVTLLALSLTGAWPAAALWWLALCLANVLLQVAYRPRVQEFVPALHQLPRFLDAAAALGALPVEELVTERERLRDGARTLGVLRRATWWLQFEPGQTNELAASVYEYVNLAFLLDVNAFVLAVDTLRTHRADLRAMFEAIGYLDAARSVGAWRATLPHWTAPEFTEVSKALAVDGLVHPLVDGAVPNALTLDGTGALITGSNMSGKSTFVRAVGLAAVLGQTLHTVCAVGWRGPLLRVRTSIGRTDSVTEGKSYYLAEAESVLGLVRASEEDTPHLFLLDEIFRGTNTTERVAAGAAVLAYLNRGPHLTLVATHDLELLDLLGEQYAAHHFREHVVAGALRFDYRLYAGPSSTHNAIALLEVLQYPPALIVDALAAADWQRRRVEAASHVTAAGSG